MKNIMIGVAAIALLLVGGSWWSRSTQAGKTGDVIALNGLHWHATLDVYVRGEKQEIPPSIGLIGAHMPIHTHEDVPVIHLEFPGRVTAEDTELGNFFENWGKEFMSFGSAVTMTVNGEPNTDLARYRMKDGDKIELRYE